MALSIIFAGTSEFALASLNALLASQHSVAAVYTKPDRPAGRGPGSAAGPFGPSRSGAADARPH